MSMHFFYPHPNKHKGETDQSDDIAFEVRNHGQSPHRRECSYEDLAADVQAFIEQEEKLSDVNALFLSPPEQAQRRDGPE
jgi:pimeloyl-ACP methyl ester carboxylesterase